MNEPARIEASKETVKPARKPAPKKSSHLHVVGKALAAGASSAAPTIPTIDELTEYRAHEGRKQLDAEESAAFLLSTKRRRQEERDEKVAMIDGERDRAVRVIDGTHDAEMRSLDKQIERHNAIDAGAAAALLQAVVVTVEWDATVSGD